MSPKYKISNGKFVLLLDFYYAGLKIKRGYSWDGATIPKLLVGSFGDRMSPQFAKPTLIHDFLYDVGVKSRVFADVAFALELLQAGVKPWKVKMMYTAVRLFGYSRWKKKK